MSDPADLLDFVQIVDMMRQAQRLYFSSRTYTALATAKRFEAMVDDEIRKLKSPKPEAV